ncbi:MAG TPA: phosphatidylcholine/phosphatidylserine synthase [Blastocatellia bacterium]|nr:phosphatidylcholine/phosphatidylserine synthase [Blastocatellia bacterium]
MSDRSTIEDSYRNQDRRVRRRFRKTVFVIPSLVTTANIFCGFYSVMESLLGVQSLAIGDVALAADHFDRAAINIGFAVLFDFLDGTIARMARATSEFGIELDSIADVLSFGVAPALLAFSWGYGQVGGLHKLGWAASFLFVICGALRLARFNVLARQPNPDLPPKNPKADKKAFVGMPIPAGASMVAAIVHFAPTPITHTTGFSFAAMGRTLVIDGQVFAIAQLALMACLAFLMVSTIRYTSFKNLGASNYHPFVLIVSLALVVMAIWFYSEWTLLVMATIYASHGVVARLWSMIRPRHAAADRAKLELDSKPQR